MAHRFAEAGVEQDFGVVVRVYVDEAGNDPLAAGVDDVGRAIDEAEREARRAAELRAELGSGIAANPYLAFYTRATASGRIEIDGRATDTPERTRALAGAGA